MDFELRHLEHALALAEHRSFARAAVSLELSQPALTRSIQALETRLGAQLFVRRRKGIEATDAGLLLLHQARDLLGRAADLQRSVGGAPTAVGGSLAVGTGPYPGDRLLGAAAVRMRRAHPAVSLDLTIRPQRELIALLRTRELDLVVVDSSVVDGQRDLEFRSLGQHVAFFAVRSGHALATAARVRLAEIVRWPLVVPGILPPRLLGPMRKAAASAPTPAVQCTSVPLMKQIVAGTDAVGIFTLTNVVGELERGELAALQCDAPWLHTDYGIVRLADRTQTATEQAFEEFLVAEDEPAATT